MGRDTLLKGTESKKEKTKQQPKAVASKKEKHATSAKKGRAAITKAKKSKTEKTIRETVSEIEKPKAITIPQDTPETRPKIEKETIAPHAQVASKGADETTNQTTREPEPEKEILKEPEPAQESVVVKTEVTMPQEPEKNNSIWIYGVSAAFLLLLVLLTASFTNSNTFSFKKRGNTVELWKGYFAPMGIERIRTFSDLQLPTDEEGKTIVKDTYTKKEAYRILFQYFLSKADDTLTSQELPDLKEVNALLEEAKEYAFTDDARETVRLRKNGLRFLLLMEKVNLALASNTEDDLLAAKAYLAEIEQIDTTPIQRQMIKEKISAVASALQKLSSEKGK